ncbi:MAG: septation protein SepH, partial [Jatrophihabitans sp.]|uniref:septation protein SepH n=1 Tax=Jatrophihabitans sp. TaxID=1932789 RepID=UPI003F7D3AED
MRELRLLRQDADSATLVFTTPDDDEQFLLHVDDMVRAAVHFDVAHAKVKRAAQAPPAPAAPSSPVSPREIQTRVRGGETAEAIADEYGVELAKILRFAGPVLEERVRIASEARRARARGGPGEGRPVVFGDFVDR